MLDRSNFANEAGPVIEWIQNYFDNIESYNVKSKVRPGETKDKIPLHAPQQPESIQRLLGDLSDTILPGITHWQHPSFFAYFPANSSVESLLAECITAALGAQCMIWETSPAAAELEERMMQWLAEMIGIPSSWEGVIQDTASTATLSAIICARERSTNFNSNENGVPAGLRIYASKETHSSIEKAVTIAGIGRNNLVKIDVNEEEGMDTDELERCIVRDKTAGLTPCCVVATLGTTGTLGMDSIEAIGRICEKHDVWLHVDAAYAGNALILPEYKYLIKGVERADSFVFNPHKWMFTNFDCSVYFVKNASQLIRTFEVLPEYLKTGSRGLVNDYRDWGIPLGRRFRALKLWFVLRGFGVNGLQQRLRHHIALMNTFVEEIESNEIARVVVGPRMNYCAIRFTPFDDEERNDEVTRRVLELVNESGNAYLSHTKLDGRYLIRVVIGQTYVEKQHIDQLINSLHRAFNDCLADFK